MHISKIMSQKHFSLMEQESVWWSFRYEDFYHLSGTPNQGTPVVYSLDPEQFTEDMNYFKEN